MTDTVELNPREQIRKWSEDHKERQARFFPKAQPSPRSASQAEEQPAAPSVAPADDDGLDAEFPLSPTAGITVEFILLVVARDYSIGREDMASAKRTQIVVRPRQVAMYLADKLTKRSLPDIGRRFGGRDHTTVLNAKAKIGWLIGERDKVYKSLRGRDPAEKVDAQLVERVARLEQLIRDMWAQRQRAIS